MVTAMRQIGYQPSEGGIYEHTTAKELFLYAASLYGKDRDQVYSQALEIATELELDIHRRISQLSFGNKKKVSLTLALAHQPKLLILDEPTSGLDPLIQNKLVRIIKDSGCAVLLSSHVLSEVQTVCQRIIFIKKARVIQEGTVEAVIKMSLSQVRVIAASSNLLNELMKMPTTQKSEAINEDTIIFTTDKLATVRKLLDANHENFFIEQPKLEQMFIDLYK